MPDRQTDRLTERLAKRHECTCNAEHYNVLFSLYSPTHTYVFYDFFDCIFWCFRISFFFSFSFTWFSSTCFSFLSLHVYYYFVVVVVVVVVVIIGTIIITIISTPIHLCYVGDMCTDKYLLYEYRVVVLYGLWKEHSTLKKNIISLSWFISFKLSLHYVITLCIFAFTFLAASVYCLLW